MLDLEFIHINDVVIVKNYRGESFYFSSYSKRQKLCECGNRPLTHMPLKDHTAVTTAHRPLSMLTISGKMDQWLALMPQIKNVLGLIPGKGRAFLWDVCMFARFLLVLPSLGRTS